MHDTVASGEELEFIVITFTYLFIYTLLNVDNLQLLR